MKIIGKLFTPAFWSSDTSGIVDSGAYGPLWPRPSFAKTAKGERVQPIAGKDNNIVATTVEPKDFDLDVIPTDIESTWGKNYGFDYHYPLVSRSPEIKEIFA
jgi:hypothetical protein